MAEKNGGTMLFEIAYGSESAIDRDVDIFEQFYAWCFREEALTRLTARTRSRNRMLFLALCIAGALLAAPMAINPSSIFAVILLAMGAMLFLGGCYFAYRMVTSGRYCEKNFDKLLSDEFASTRSATKRIFDVRFSNQAVTVDFGSKTAIKQTRSKRYADIAAVFITDELIFIKGLTWMSRFQLGDESFALVCAILKEKCPDRFVDERNVG